VSNFTPGFRGLGRGANRRRIPPPIRSRSGCIASRSPSGAELRRFATSGDLLPTCGSTPPAE